MYKQNLEEKKNTKRELRIKLIDCYILECVHMLSFDTWNVTCLFNEPIEH